VLTPYYLTFKHSWADIGFISGFFYNVEVDADFDVIGVSKYFINSLLSP
jgi:hypothetical protein